MFTLTLVTPEKKILSGAEIEEVFVPATKGELNILPGHAPLMTTLETGVLRYRLKGEAQPHAVAISWGYMQVNPNGVNVLAETAEQKEDIDVARADRALKEAEAFMAGDQLTADNIEKYRNKILRAQIRKEVGSSSTH